MTQLIPKKTAWFAPAYRLLLRHAVKNFAESLTVRGINLSIGVLLVGSGLVPLLHLPIDTVLPIVLVAAGLITLVSLIMGANDHPAQVAFAAVTLPVAFWGFVMIALYCSTRPALGALLVGAGVVTYGILAFLRASKTRPSAIPAPAPAE